MKNKRFCRPERPSDVRAHDVEPEKRGEKRKLNDECCKKNITVDILFYGILRINIASIGIQVF